MLKNIALVAALALAAAAPMAAQAATYSFTFGGAGGVSGAVTLTYGTAADAKYANAFEITGVSGTFSDSTLGISNASILGLVQVAHNEPEAGNTLAPHDFSRFAVATGTSAESGGFVTYDNLFWPGGAPQTANTFPTSGGIFDIYGLMFRIGNNRVVDIWSNGSAIGNTYGVNVATTDALLHGVTAGVTVTPVPEPETLALMLAGLGVLGFVARRR
jgi:hypothetical protein